MKNPQELAITIKMLAKQRKITIGKMLSDCQLSVNTLSSMQSGGYYPRLEALAKIADYLDCSVDYLLGRTDVPDADLSLSAHNDESQELSSLFVFNSVKQRENMQKEKPAPVAGNGLSEKDMQLLKMIMSLPDDKYEDAMDYMRYLISKRDK